MDQEDRYGAKNVIELFIPVSLSMLIVVGTLKATDSYHYSSQTIIWYAQMMFTDQTVDTWTRVWQSFANAFFMLMFIVIMTCVLITLYKLRCYATIHGWLILSSLLLLFAFAIMYISQILKVYNIPMDYYTISLIIWNFGVVGMVCIHWKGPLLMQQGYLITISAFLALVFIRCLPDWTVWTVLGIVSIWDLVAVLCPIGPLRILVETAQERNEPIFPALLYSSTMTWWAGTPLPSLTMTRRDQHPVEIHYEVGFSGDQNQPPAQNEVAVDGIETQNPAPQVRADNQMEEERGVKLGLGDFIFYSVLIGKASSYGDWTITMSCYVSILVGLCLTLTLLAVFKKALPALPISIVFGMSSLALSYVFVVPMAENLSINQIFI